MTTRCSWAENHPLLRAYHDGEWGVRTNDRLRLFEFIVLEGAQAGLSWLTVLKRRESYRQAFANFNPDVLALWSDNSMNDLVRHPGLIRNRAKITSVFTNARAFLSIEGEFGGFDRYLTTIVGAKTLVHHYQTENEIPAYDPLAETLSRDLRNRGFRFMGPTISYSYLQAIGMVMDHVTSCFRFQELMAKARN